MSATRQDSRPRPITLREGRPQGSYVSRARARRGRVSRHRFSPPLTRPQPIASFAGVGVAAFKAHIHRTGRPSLPVAWSRATTTSACPTERCG